MKNKYYELIDEHVFEHELENGLRLFVIPKKKGFRKHLLHIRLSLAH